MILKTIHQRMPFGVMLQYLRDDKGNRDNANDLEFFHNLSSLDPKEIRQEFEELYALKPTRTNSVRFVHEVMSFSPESSQYLTDEVLSDLAYKYLEKRCFYGLAYGCLHSSEEHIHLHFMISSNRIDDPTKSIRMSNKEFRNIRLEIERYQVEKYPELKDSIVYTKDKKKEKYHAPKERETNKIKLIEIIDQVFNSSNSRDLKSFCESLDSTPGLTVYHYRNKPHGILFEGKKYRFSTLGFSQQIKMLEKLDKLRTLRESKEHEKDSDFYPETE
ncbi:relaxase/mobilization nuclease domain-containing protein [Roseivirga pacifica]|uniref:relaxase/mobilization nuclease domain-containing protein n=1 Tax=Roseivirga pacifica TaxID=1267423 RepID=UPI003BA97FF9